MTAKPRRRRTRHPRPNARAAGAPAPARRSTPLDVLKALGPGIISGASDNDPTTVATLAVLGATTIYGLSWLTVLLFPMLAVIQIISARVGVVARRGLQQDVRTRYGRHWGAVLLLAVLVVNLITISADLEGGAAALSLLFHVSWQWFVLPFAAAMVLLLVFGSYAALERVLKYVLLVFVAYVGAAFAAHPDWGRVLHDTIAPPISFHRDYIEGALALLGTTLSSYAYVWETIEEAEESGGQSRRRRLAHLGLAEADAGVGMFLAVAIFWFILISTGATLGIKHQQVQTAQDAARALQPVAGAIASYLFAIGLLASAILAVPVLAASSAYIVGEEFDWRCGLSERVRHAPRFYAVLLGTVVVGVVIAYLGISPIQLLYWSSIAGGLGTPISLVFLLKIARDHRLMGEETTGRVVAAVGWLTTALVTAISLYFLYQQLGRRL